MLELAKAGLWILALIGITAVQYALFLMRGNVSGQIWKVL